MEEEYAMGWFRKKENFEEKLFFLSFFFWETIQWKAYCMKMQEI